MSLKRSIPVAALTLALAVGTAGAVGGCKSKTEGQRTLDKADRMQEAGELIRRGEQLEADGRANIARGETIRDQGDRTTGDRIIAQGKAQQAQGRELKEQGRRMRDDP